MTATAVPSELSIAMQAACALAVECWRLKRLSELTADASARAVVRRAVRQLTETLEELSIEVIDFVGRPYDSGMVPEVVEVRDGLEQSEQAVVEETVAPTITWRGQVVIPGRIIVSRFGTSSVESSRIRE
jgi:hypothetical protein